MGREPAFPLEDSPSMRAIWSVIEHVADTDATILLLGESGVGKDFVGRAVQHARARREFREDLYHRVNIVELVAEFLARFNARYGRQKELSPETLAHLTEYPWTGNVGALENIVRRMVVLADGEQAFTALAAGARNGRPDPLAPACSLAESLTQIARRGAREAERAALEDVLEQVYWNRAEASRILRSATRRCSTRSPSAA